MIGRSTVLTGVVAVALMLFAVPAHAKDKKWDVPCEKVFVTGTQIHEVAWALSATRRYPL